MVDTVVFVLSGATGVGVASVVVGLAEAALGAGLVVFGVECLFFASLYFLFELEFEVGVGAGEEVVVELQLADLGPGPFEFLPECLHFRDQFLQLLVVQLVELLHFHLDQLSLQLAVLPG